MINSDSQTELGWNGPGQTPGTPYMGLGPIGSLSFAPLSLILGPIFPSNLTCNLTTPSGNTYLTG